MSARANLNELCKAVSDLCFGERSEEGEVEESVHWCVVGTQSVLVVPVVDRNLDGDRGVNESDHSCGNADVVRVAAVCCTSKTGRQHQQVFKSKNSTLSSKFIADTQDKTYPQTSVTRPPPMQRTGS